MKTFWIGLGVLGVALAAGCGGAGSGGSTGAVGGNGGRGGAVGHAVDEPGKVAALRGRVGHVIVIYQENWSFDGLYGKFPGANGIANAGAAAAQVDLAGHAYGMLPTCYHEDEETEAMSVDGKVPAGLGMGPFNLSGIYGDDEITGDLVHRFYQEQEQIDGGKMDKFAAVSDAGGLVMSYYDVTGMPEGKLAGEYTLCDNFFHAAFGGSFLNHQWLIAARTPYWGDAPADKRAKVFGGKMSEDGYATPEGFVVNTIRSVYKPWKDGKPGPMPGLTYETIGDRLDGAGVDWAWYSGGFDDAMAGRPDKTFQFHHQPFTYFTKYGDEAAAGHRHLQDETKFEAALKTGVVPAVCFVKPVGDFNEHPGYSRLVEGQKHVGELVKEIQGSPIWGDTIVIITYDENGGRWDHVAPPVVDEWGPGTRVPTIVVSPFAKRHYIDSTEYDTTSILRLIESRWTLAPLGERDRNANNMLNALDFSGGEGGI